MARLPRRAHMTLAAGVPTAERSLLRIAAAAELLLMVAAQPLLPSADFAHVPIASWCGNATGPLSKAAAQAFASRPLAVFEKDMAQEAPPYMRSEEGKIAAAAAQVKAISPATQVLMYSTVGSLLPQYSMSDWFAARPHLMLHDDSGAIIVVNYTLACPSHRPGCTPIPSPCPWVDFSQPAAVAGWVDSLWAWVANKSVDGVALDGNPFDDEWITSVGGSPGILANVSSASKRAAFIRGLNAAELELGQRIVSAGGVLMANGIHKPGNNGMLFEEWCSEHSYLRRRNGCDGTKSPIGCGSAYI
eukprot:COSAG05_NODE_535_length_8871_cov_311.345759_10_plen_303_part_00